MTKHIVDMLIEERAERLVRRPRVWRWLKKYCFSLLYYHQAVLLVDGFKEASAQTIMAEVAKRTRLNVDLLGLERVPDHGAAVVVANHPAGIADGIALYEALRQKRPDICFFANRDATRCAPQLQDVIIPVEWAAARRSRAKSRETLKAISAAISNERLIVIFPSGRLAQPTLFGLRERPWAPSAVAIASTIQEVPRFCQKSAPEESGKTPKEVGQTRRKTGILAQIASSTTLRCKLYPTLIRSFSACSNLLTSSKSFGSKKKWPTCRSHIAIVQPIKAAAVGLI